MALQQRLWRMTQIFRPSIIRSAFFHDTQVTPPVKNEVKENSAEYSSDGEKIYCGLKFRGTGDKTEEEVAFILESARAKAFAESVNRVVNNSRVED